jgi:thioredoxin reductase (NADPH)
VATDYDVVVAGGGIAGLTAGLTAARLGRSALVLTGGAPGGLLLSIDSIEGIPGFPDGVAGYELCPGAQEQAADAGAEFRMALLEGLEQDDDGGWRVQASDGEVSAATVVLAMGGRLQELGAPGEERLQGRGISHCASCDAPMLREKVVAVAGGGDSGAQEALTLAESVSEVILLERGESLAAQESFRRRVTEHERITVVVNTVVEEVLGDDAVSAVRVRELASGEERQLDVSALFCYVGLAPNSEPVASLLALDAAGHVPTDSSCRTQLPGVLAAGWLRSAPTGRAAAAAGEGASAAVAADRYLSDGAWLDHDLAAAALRNGGSQ